ncbi:hypothetical protein L1D19_24705 [Vibrio natriegens]|uniref:hypothetical protein n=1 Tax=Vibrio natriegens TaxID=691 RepID=UPI001EFC3391|nr:hypothetical protein [Vibrio natriegens]MCG9703264.1 hypothetical protein [Vibrio natriegens]
MPNLPYHRLLSLHAHQQDAQLEWRLDISEAMDILRIQFASFLGVPSLTSQNSHHRYVEWQTPSYDEFSLDKPGVIEYLNGHFVVCANIIIALVRGQETSVSYCQCPVQIRRCSTGVEYRVVLQRERWTGNVETVIQRIMMALVKQLTRSL